ncbi:right-handed parallel beta-helix repeat-containing protein, partial [Candidatus Roizmanbacteria bacterium]|nr:right-handed parallel beta-helix repeat-containing protein [Candidatus Roizmanbacteria bacterium]
MIKNTRIIVLFLLFGLSFLSFLFSRAVTSPNEKAVFHSRATTSGKTITVSGVSRVAIQQAIDSAKDGDTIIIPQGTYLSSDSEPFELPPDYPGKNKPDGCFINLRGKSLILKGQGAILFGEGHDKAYVEPLASRVGVCSFGGSITIDNVRIKEFQKGCGFFINVALIVKNSIIEGCDEGGLKLLGDSTALFVNNYFVATNAFSMMGNSNVKAVNNTMYSSNVFYFPQADFIPKAELINNIIVNGE